MLNSVILHGRLTADPELKDTTTGTSVTNLRVAVQRPKRNGEDAGADYVDVVAFGTTAENVARYLSKGRAVLVNGRLRHSEWTDKETGKKRQKLEVVANEVEFLGSGKPAAGAEAADGNDAAVADFEV